MSLKKMWSCQITYLNYTDVNGCGVFVLGRFLSCYDDNVVRFTDQRFTYRHKTHEKYYMCLVQPGHVSLWFYPYIMTLLMHKYYNPY